MKLQTIIFTLLQAQSVFSNESPSHDTFDDCALPCKSQLRMNQSKLEECLKLHCGGNEEPKGGIDVELLGNHGSCVSRCNRLRFSRRKQLQCIDDCDGEYSPGRRSSSATPSGNFEDAEQCEARCRRLRFSHDRQLACIQDCHSQDVISKSVYDHVEGSSGDETPTRSKSDFDTEESEEKSADFPHNTNACVSRCKRPRFSPARQEKCIDECNEDESPSKRSDFNANDSEQIDSDPSGSNNNPCVARCNRLRFGPTRKADCIKKCPTDAFYATVS